MSDLRARVEDAGVRSLIDTDRATTQSVANLYELASEKDMLERMRAQGSVSHTPSRRLAPITSAGHAPEADATATGVTTGAAASGLRQRRSVTGATSGAMRMPYSSSGAALYQLAPGAAAAGGERGGATPSISPSASGSDITPQLAFFNASLPLIRQGASAFVDDSFTRCFKPAKRVPWNWNVYLFPAWLMGVVIRYSVLFPLRCLVVILGFLLVAVGMAIVKALATIGIRTSRWEIWLVQLLASSFVASWSGVIRIHGIRPQPRDGQPAGIFVANHTSMIDFMVLLQSHPYAVVGQKHPGWVGFIQGSLLRSLHCLWFNRDAEKDRRQIAEAIKAHARNPGTNHTPLLIFPEGTCVNNEYAVQFKKFVFELGVPINPVAIKYNKAFVDGYWNSREQSFLQHLIRLMTSWAVVVDVWFLDQQRIRPGESAAEFATRIQRMVAARAGLKAVDWDGYMKHWKPSARFIEARQRAVAAEILSGAGLVDATAAAAIAAGTSTPAAAAGAPTAGAAAPAAAGDAAPAARAGIAAAVLSDSAAAAGSSIAGAGARPTQVAGSTTAAAAPPAAAMTGSATAAAPAAAGAVGSSAAAPAGAGSGAPAPAGGQQPRSAVGTGLLSFTELSPDEDGAAALQRQAEAAAARHAELRSVNFRVPRVASGPGSTSASSGSASVSTSGASGVAGFGGSAGAGISPRNASGSATGAAGAALPANLGQPTLAAAPSAFPLRGAAVHQSPLLSAMAAAAASGGPAGALQQFRLVPAAGSAGAALPGPAGTGSSQGLAASTGSQAGVSSAQRKVSTGEELGVDLDG